MAAQRSLTEYCETQDINLFRIKKHTIPARYPSRPKSSIASQIPDQKNQIKQSIISNYISTQYSKGFFEKKENKQSSQPSLNKSHSRKRNQKSSKIIALSKNYQIDNNKSVNDIDKKNHEIRKLRISEGYFSNQAGVIKKFIYDTEAQVHEIEKLMRIIDNRYERKSESLETILKEVDMIENRIKQLERSLSSIQNGNTEQETLKIQAIQFTIISILNRISKYNNLKNVQCRIMRSHSTNEQTLFNNDTRYQDTSKQFDHSKHIDNFKSKNIIRIKKNSQQYNDNTRFNIQNERQRTFAEYIFVKFNNAMNMLNSLKNDQVNEALDLILQLNQELSRISNMQEYPYAIKAQALQCLYELDCQIPQLFSLLLQILNNNNQKSELNNQQQNVYENIQSKDQQKRLSQIKPRGYSLESPSTSQKIFMIQATQNQNLSNNISQTQYTQQDQLYSSIQQQEEEDFNTPNNSNNTNFNNHNNSNKDNINNDHINNKNNNVKKQKQIQLKSYSTSGINNNKFIQKQDQIYKQNKISYRSLKEQNYTPQNNNSNNAIDNSNSLQQIQQNKDDVIYSSIISQNVNPNLQNIIPSISISNTPNQLENNSYISNNNNIIQQNLSSKNNQLLDNHDDKIKSIHEPDIHENQQSIDLDNYSNNIKDNKSDNNNLSQNLSNNNSIKNPSLNQNNSQINDNLSENKNNNDNNIDMDEHMKEFFYQIRVLIDHINIIFSKKILKELIEFIQNTEYKNKRVVLNTLTQVNSSLDEISQIQGVLNQYPQYESIYIDDDQFWNTLEFIQSHQEKISSIKKQLYDNFQISNQFKGDEHHKIVIQDFADLKQQVMKLKETTDFPILNLQLPNNLNVNESIVTEIKERRKETQIVLNELIDIISSITEICQRKTFSIYKLIAFVNPFYTHSEKILTLLTSSVSPHFTLAQLLNSYNNLKHLFLQQSFKAKLKSIVDKILFITFYEELIIKIFKNLETEAIFSLTKGEIKLKAIKQRIKKLLQSTNEIQTVLLDNNYDYNRIDHFRLIINQYLQQITLQQTIFNTNESSFITGRDQAFNLLEQIYSYLFFTKSLSQPQSNNLQNRSKSPLNLTQNSIGFSKTLSQTSPSQTEVQYYNQIQKIPPQTLKELKQKISQYLILISMSRERLNNFIQQNEQSLQQKKNEDNSYLEQDQATQEQISEAFKQNLYQLSFKLENIMKYITELLSKQRLPLIDLLQIVQVITEYLEEKKEDIAIIKNKQEKTIFVMTYNYGCDYSMVIQQINYFMNHNNNQNNIITPHLLPQSKSEDSIPQGPIVLIYDSLNSSKQELYINSNNPTDAFTVGELVIQNQIDGEILFQDYIETNKDILKVELSFSLPYIIANISFPDHKQKQALLFSSDISLIEYTKKDLAINENSYKIIISENDQNTKLRQSLSFFIHSKITGGKEYIINEQTDDPNGFVQKEIIETPFKQILIIIQQNPFFEYTFYANLIISDVFQVFKNGKATLNQINITSIRQDNPHTWRIFQIPKQKIRSITQKKQREINKQNKII